VFVKEPGCPLLRSEGATVNHKQEVPAFLFNKVGLRLLLLISFWPGSKSKQLDPFLDRVCLRPVVQLTVSSVNQKKSSKSGDSNTALSKTTRRRTI